jgi:hypothetical protein
MCQRGHVVCLSARNDIPDLGCGLLDLSRTLFRVGGRSCYAERERQAKRLLFEVRDRSRLMTREDYLMAQAFVLAIEVFEGAARIV